MVDGQRTTTDVSWLDGYTISSPCEPNGSGELKIFRQRNSIFLKKRAIASIENVFVYSDRYGHSDLKSD